MPWRLAVEDYAYTVYVAYCCMFIMIFINHFLAYMHMRGVYKKYTRVGDFHTPTHQPTNAYVYVCIHVHVCIHCCLECFQCCVDNISPCKCLHVNFCILAVYSIRVHLVQFYNHGTSQLHACTLARLLHFFAALESVSNIATCTSVCNLCM